MSGDPVIGIDLGGTKIQSLVVDGTGQILGEDRRPTVAGEGLDAVVDRMMESVGRALDQSGVAPTAARAVGVSAPGPCDFDHGVLLHAPNLPGWVNVPLTTLIEERLGLPTFLENDANAAALAEARYGAGQGARHLIYLTISTGIGGGLILDGGIYRGADGTAGELGHVTVDEQGPLHNCGMRGCLEVLASGTAIGRMAQEAALAGRSERLATAAAGGELNAVAVHAAAEAGDPVADEILEKASHYLGVGLANLLNIFNPQVIVIGGGVAHIGARLLDPAIELARSRAFRLPAQTVRFRTAALEGRAEALGAAALARESTPTVGR
jgi:glucokinase